MLLLMLVAFRARYADEPCPVLGLEHGEARIGDHESAGLSRQQYRTALETLEKLKFVTTKRTKKGTICKILVRPEQSTIFSIAKQPFQPSKEPSDQPDSNHQPTISQPLKNKERREEGNNILMELWNSNEQLPKIRSISNGRKKHLQARMREPYFIENWQTALNEIPRRPFLMGENDRGWKADIDWFLKPDSVTKIMEGKFLPTTPYHKTEFLTNDFKL